MALGVGAHKLSLDPRLLCSLEAQEMMLWMNLLLGKDSGSFVSHPLCLQVHAKEVRI